VVKAREDDGSINYQSAAISLQQLTVFFDRGIIEIFANRGAMCGTRRSHSLDAIVDVEIIPSPATQISNMEAWSNRSAWDRAHVIG
jgi:beta-fructofuranosidase